MNDFGINLAGKQGVFKGKAFYLPNASEKDRTFVCESGSGCNPDVGTKREIKGHWLSDGARDTIDSSQLESVVDGDKTIRQIEPSVEVAEMRPTTVSKKPRAVRRKR